MPPSLLVAWRAIVCLVWVVFTALCVVFVCVWLHGRVVFAILRIVPPCVTAGACETVTSLLTWAALKIAPRMVYLVI